MSILFYFYFLITCFKDFHLFIFRERGLEREREGQKHQCVVASHAAPTGDMACNPGMCPDWESNRRPFGLQPVLNLLSYTSQGRKLILLICKEFLRIIKDRKNRKKNQATYNLPEKMRVTNRHRKIC